METVQLGKIPPHNIKTEMAALGGLIRDNGDIDLAVNIVDEDCFYKDQNRLIFTTIIEMYNKNRTIDLITVNDELKKNGNQEQVGGVTYLTEVAGSFGPVEYSCYRLAELKMRRQIILTGMSLQKSGYDDTIDVFDLTESSEKAISDVVSAHTKGQAKKASQLVAAAFKRIDEIATSGALTGLPSGYTDIDRITSGFEQDDFVIIAARPSMGKSALAGCILRNIAVDFGRPVAMFSLEMSSEQLIYRMIAAEAQVDSVMLRNAELPSGQMRDAYEKSGRIYDSPIYIDDEGGLSLISLKAKLRKMKAQYGIECAFIDYLQLMTLSHKSKDRQAEMSEIARALKGIAKELRIPIIAMSQLSRAVETRGGSKRPILSDLRETGEIEQAADKVVFLYRENYYDHDCGHNQTEIIVSKNRNGRIGTANLEFIGHCVKFIQGDNTEFNTGEPEPY